MKASLFNGSPRAEDRGFALVATLSLMLLLLLLTVGMLSLSAVSLRNSGIDSDRQKARANARMALMVAIGKLQIEMGPDMRISAEAAIHDTDPATEEIEGVAQPHWTAAYDSWGNWLNATYTPEGKLASDVSSIGDTYVAKRTPMFRRWLVSLPDDLQTDVNAAATPLDEEESVIMVGEGTLGLSHATVRPENVTRAYKVPVGDRGTYAWWISPENHKAKINLAAQQRELSADEWATAQCVSSEVAIGGITGLENLDVSNASAASMASRVLTLKTLELAGVEEDRVREMFFDLTEVSSGVLSNTRSGGLKKDLSLLFENSDTTIAPEYAQASRLSPEPSIRPHSKDVLAENAVLPRRPFASWPSMRHYYRMYRADTDTPLPTAGHVAQAEDLSDPAARVRYLSDSVGRASAGVHAPVEVRESNKDVSWNGENSYLRFPIIARFLIIHSYKTIIAPAKVPNGDPPKDEHFLQSFNTPVVTYWNPYSVPLVIKDKVLGNLLNPNVVWPQEVVSYNSDGSERDAYESSNVEHAAPLRGASNDPNSPRADIVFEPGELKMFSYPPDAHWHNRSASLGEGNGYFGDPLWGLHEGFDPSSPGSFTDWGVYRSYTPISTNLVFDQTLSLDVRFRKAKVWFNKEDGNTPGSLSLKMQNKLQNFNMIGMPPHYQIDWFQASQQMQSITGAEDVADMLPLIENPDDPLPIAYTLFTLKSANRIETTASWAEDWRSRNWLHAPPYYFGSALYMTEDSETRAHTQRLDSPYEVSFGPTSDSELGKLIAEINGKPILGYGSNPREKVTAVPAIELPTAPLSSLASFSGMRMSPGWIWSSDLNPDWVVRTGARGDINPVPSAQGGYVKTYQYQSGITGGGIGNSFIHPMIPREEVYFYHNNSVSHNQVSDSNNNVNTTPHDTKAYCDYWDHVLMLNDSLWDEYFISSIADQTRTWATESVNLQTNIEALTNGEGLPISRYQYHNAGMDTDAVNAKLIEEDAYLRSAEHLTVDGAFNVNSTSVNAWYALFKGIRERKLFYRDTTSGGLKEVEVPEGHIALSRFDTATTDKETTDSEYGVSREDGNMAWSGVRFLNDEQVMLLAKKCVEQVKRRGPFLNFSEFINRRLEDNELGLMGALQSAIDFDDESPDDKSINYLYKRSSGLMMDEGALGDHEFSTSEAANGSRLAGIPGYVIQSDLLKPIANTLQVRDDTFRVRAYGEALDAEGNVIARAWCEAIVQRNPEYADPANEAHEAAFNYEADPSNGFDPRWDGEFAANGDLTPTNRLFGRKFEIKSFRWLASGEI